MKKNLLGFCLFFAATSYANDQSIQCSDANQLLTYKYDRKTALQSPDIEIIYGEKIIYKKSSSKEQAEINQADYWFNPLSYAEIEKIIQSEAEDALSVYKREDILFSQKLEIKSREEGKAIFDSYVICEMKIKNRSI